MGKSCWVPSGRWLQVFEPDLLRLSQVRALLRYAGWLDPPALADVVGVTVPELAEAARFFRVDLRRFDSQAVWCSSCGCQRVPGKGGCPVCRKRETLARAKATEQAAWEALTPQERERLEARSSYGRRHAQADTMRRPRKADYPPALPFSEYARREAREQYVLALQAYDLAQLQRDFRSSQKRAERWRDVARRRGGSS